MTFERSNRNNIKKSRSTWTNLLLLCALLLVLCFVVQLSSCETQLLANQNRQQTKSIIDELQADNKMEVRHKFAFTVNGKQFALEPPKEISSKIAASPNARYEQNVNRMGESISADYESGFDVSSESDNFRPTTTSGRSSKLMQSSSLDYPTNELEVAAGGSRKSSQLPSPLSSTSSALMSASNEDFGEQLDADADNNNNVELRKNSNRSSLISSRDKQTYQTDRDSAKGEAKFSKLLASNQQPEWDAKVASLKSPPEAARSKLPVKSLESSSSRKNDIQSKTSPKKSEHLKSPAMAKLRYTSTGAQMNQVLAKSSLAKPQSAIRAPLEQVAEPEKASEQSKVKSRQTNNSPMISAKTAANSSRRSMNELSDGQSIVEHKTNFTAFASTPKQSSSSSSSRRQKAADEVGQTGSKQTEQKSQIVQRDLSHKLALNSLLNHAQSSDLNNYLTASRVGSNLSESSQLSRLQKWPQMQANSERSIIRTGPILPYPLKSLSPSSVAALLAQASDEHPARSSHLRALLAAQQIANSNSFILPDSQSSSSMAGKSSMANLSQSPSNNEQLAANSAAHLQPANFLSMGASETNNYNSIASLQDYPESSRAYANSQNVVEPNNNSNNNNNNNNLDSTNNPQASASNNNEQRSGFSEPHPDSSNLYESSGSPLRGSSQPSNAHFAPTSSEQPTNSRSSLSEGYINKLEQGKNRDSNAYPLRASLDPFEDLNSLSASEYERDLADLDEEFNRHSGYRRPNSGSQLMSDSFMSLSPDRYDARRYQRRPNYDYSGDYLSAAGSMSSSIPRNFQRSPASHWSAGADPEQSELWDSQVDFSPLQSFVAPNHYAPSYRWRPRYQRVSPYLTSSASEQHLQPAYNIVPSYSSALSTSDVLSFAISPLAAAAAAAATAIAAADKSRQQHNSWLSIPRIPHPASLSATNQATAAAAASAQHATAALPATAYIQHRPTPYALSPLPIYAISPRPGAPIAAAASAASPSIIPYFHAPHPTIIYRPTSVVPPTSLLTAASFAYPFRVPIHTMIGARPSSVVGISAQPISARPAFLSDLQFAESKSKSNQSNNNQNNNQNSEQSRLRSASLTAMAKNLKKMFGSASQLRPQHVAAPNSPTYDLFSPLSSHNSSSLAQH